VSTTIVAARAESVPCRCAERSSGTRGGRVRVVPAAALRFGGRGSVFYGAALVGLVGLVGLAGITTSQLVEAQSSGTTPAPPPKPTLVDPSRSKTASSPKKYGPLAARLRSAADLLTRGKRAEARKEFEAILAAETTHPVARRYLAEILLDEGDWDAARRAIGKSATKKLARDPVPLENWRVIGPFPHRGHERSLREVYEPERKFDSSPRASYEGDGRICRWKSVKGPRIDHREILEIDDAAVAFAYCEFAAKTAGWVRIGFASSDGVKAWLNDELILERVADRDIREDSDLVWVWLPSGKNRLLLKVESDGGAFRHYVQVYDDLEAPSTEFLDAAIAARKAFASGRFADAERDFLRAESLSPGHPDVALGLSRALLARGNPVAARGWCRRALGLRPGSVEGLIVHAETLFALGDPGRGFLALRAAYLESGRTHDAAFTAWIGHAERLADRSQAGIASLEKARSLRAQNRAAEADAVVSSVRAELANSFVGLAELSDYLRDVGSKAEADAMAVAAIRSVRAEVLAGQVSIDWLLRLAIGMPSGSVERAEILAVIDRIDPSHPRVIEFRISALAAASPADAALERAALARALRERPTKEGYRLLAKHLLDEKLHDETVTVCKDALAAGVVSRKIRQWLGGALEALERFDEAEEVYRSLLPEREYADAAREALERVRRKRASGRKARRGSTSAHHDPDPRVGAVVTRRESRATATRLRGRDLDG
jgi:tetratricopeptide (TPR) repeat protein